MKALILLIIGCSLADFADPAVDRDKVAAMVARLDKARDAYGRNAIYLQIFDAVGPQGLRDLKSNADDSLALQAAWKEVTLTVPSERAKEVYRPGSRELTYFLGYCEGRTRVSPPEWWREMLLDARANKRDNIYAGEPKIIPYQRSGNDSVPCPTDTTIQDSKSGCVFSIGNEKQVLPEEILDRCDDRSLCNGISGCFTSDRCYVTEHSSIGYSHKLACVDRKTGKLVWQSRVCGCWWGFGSGSHNSYVRVVATDDDRVVVFGTASPGMYFHCFRATDGTSLAQFSTNYAR